MYNTEHGREVGTGHNYGGDTCKDRRVRDETDNWTSAKWIKLPKKRTKEERDFWCISDRSKGLYLLMSSLTLLVEDIKTKETTAHTLSQIMVCLKGHCLFSHLLAFMRLSCFLAELKE